MTIGPRKKPRKQHLSLINCLGGGNQQVKDLYDKNKGIGERN